MTPGPAVRRPSFRLATIAILGLALTFVIARIAWHPASPPNDPPPRPRPVDGEAIEQLKSVGYSAWSETSASAQSGVVHYEPERSYGGYNLYTDYTDAATLVDMHGHVVHRWRFPAGEGISREFARMLPDGSLLSHGPFLVKQAWNGQELSRLAPQVGDAFSHDLEILPNGSMLIPSTKGVQYNGYPVNMEYVEHFTPDLKLHCSWSSLQSIEQLHRFHPPTMFDVKGQTLDSTDYYHANTIRVLPDNPFGRTDRRFRKGNWLICLRQVSLVAIIDQDTRDVVWGWGPGVLDHPHSPVMLPDGGILVFDNGMNRGYSRLLKIDPRTKDVTWSYEGHPRESFFTTERGFVQPLPNGNLQVTLSGDGRALEMTTDGRVVWEFYHPETEDGHRRAIYRMIRYPQAMVDRLLHPHPEVYHASGPARRRGRAAS
jgi:hypothetical protein